MPVTMTKSEATLAHKLFLELRNFGIELLPRDIFAYGVEVLYEGRAKNIMSAMLLVASELLKTVRECEGK